ncbi:glycosyltransferase family 69 protein [Piedraia hortae CBS 480.64]|uniref:Glycosyltransferase family 69 protein n=1 Tax=Piedraia hortae CBS 480.64 TaxID=1314780 RepID=A0A6A7C2L9_9PEZI|nr:glycosyltransferase family 69 protein [Piedraia hortae CBS 480.64]
MLIRPRWSRVVRMVYGILAVLSTWTLLDVVNVHRPQLIPPPPFGPNERIFIASIHWTDEAVLRARWAPAVASLARTLGSDNVFVSIYESGSFDDTKGALQLLNEDLSHSHIPHRIILDDAMHRDEVEKQPATSGWIQMPQSQQFRANWTHWFTLEKGHWVPRRIPYLARLRNRVMEPLTELQRDEGKVFDKILWLNDVVFDTDDVKRLLATNDGVYAAACALDFKRPPSFYDTFALRDWEGYAPISDVWPYFRSKTSRKPMIKGQPVPVSSCWNGMVMLDAKPFYQNLQFRAIDDSLAKSHLEGSECCLIHYDNPLTGKAGVWVNPNVRVTYDAAAYGRVKGGVWPKWPWNIVAGIWKNRFNRWCSRGHRDEKRVIAKRLAQWQGKEPGADCLIDEMHIMLWNGWGHA